MIVEARVAAAVSANDGAYHNHGHAPLLERIEKPKRLTASANNGGIFPLAEYYFQQELHANGCKNVSENKEECNGTRK